MFKLLRHPVSDEDSLRASRLVLSGCGVEAAYKDYHYQSRSPDFSRNGTAHAVNAELYQELNALKAITLTACWLRLLSVQASEADRRSSAA